MFCKLITKREKVKHKEMDAVLKWEKKAQG